MIAVVLTLFPDAVRPYLEQSILGIAERKGLLRTLLVDFREYTGDRHRTVDDRPFGGGPGMVLKPEPIFAAIEDVERQVGSTRKVLFTPRGNTFGQRLAEEYAREERLLLLCGRYEGIDERVHQAFSWDEISLGDFVLSGGEIPALAVIEAMARLVPGVLGDERSAQEDSFARGREVDWPQYTRPRVFRDMEVPEVLFSGDHGAIKKWREEEADRLTRQKYADEDG
jgi:tRNA (guanine37-N1)-methyltransferase